ncbi:MAG: class I SAM-dependent methyltransferase [Pseudomonadota bacterium]|nr:class I SAM-dependent methyltransferase [Pseudomonadota bacterium]MDO7711362.1 class I SAM-dependent methyltransferase [Pseudomonadota bacterium]
MIDYKTDIQKKMITWWQSPLGCSVLKQEKSALQSLSKHFYGNYQFQLGLEQRLLPEVPRSRMQKIMGQSADLDGRNESLPFKCHSLDTLLLVHVIEFSTDPHQVLREAERVLESDGTLVLCCFNPWSFWGLRRLFSFTATPPWHGHFFSQTRIKDWLALLNFEVAATERLVFHPPIQSERWLTRSLMLERVGKRLWPIFSGVTILVATKRTIPLTRITMYEHVKHLFPTGRLVSKPIAREKNNG